MPVKKRGKTWQVRINYTVNGQHKQKSKSGFKTKSDAVAYEAQILNDINTDKFVINGDTLFTDYYDSWLDVHLKTGIASRTIRNHEMTQKYVHEYFAGVKLVDLNRLMVQNWINEFSINRKSSTVREHFNRIKMPIRSAFSDGLIRHDPTFNIKLPKPSKSEKIKYLEKNEMNLLLSNLESNDLTPKKFAIYISLLSGLRLGEVMALTYKDINTRTKELTVNKSKKELAPFSYGKPKTESSYRSLMMPERFFKQLKRFKKENPDADEHFIGERTTQAMINYELNKLTTKLDINPITFHGLRHTHASFLINEGIDIAYVSARLGHSNISMTERVYFHLLSHKKEAEQDRAMNLFF